MDFVEVRDPKVIDFDKGSKIPGEYPLRIKYEESFSDIGAIFTWSRGGIHAFL